MTTTATRVILPAATSAAGTVGAIVGGAVAAAQDLKRVNDGLMTKKEAAADIGKEAVGTGLSTAAGVFVTGALGMTGVIGFASLIGVAVGTKYFWDKKFGYKPKKEVVEIEPRH